MKVLQHRAVRLAAGALIAVAACLAIVYLAARVLLGPQPGEWSVPLRWGPLQLQAGGPTLIRLATAPWLAPLLDGRVLATRAGPARLGWDDASRTLSLRCAPCAVHVAALGSEPLVFAEVLFTLQRQGELLNGTLTSGKVRANWRSVLEKDALRVHLKLPMTPIAEVYALARAAIPELTRARIEGNVGLSAALHLPGKEFSIAPDIEGFQVSGLDTQALANARSSCSNAPSRLTLDSWLAHAVVAAEDQRPDDNGPDDLTEADVAPAPGQSAQPQGQAGRGNSTLSQQLARLLVTGEAGSPTRKLRELLYAVEMERTLGKPLILQLYLAHAPWGPGVCGAEAASRRYFGVRADVLTPSQAAWLAAMLHDPKQEVAQWGSSGRINVERTQWVLQGMLALPRKQRQRLVAEVAKLKWKLPAPAAAPKPGAFPKPPVVPVPKPAWVPASKLASAAPKPALAPPPKPASVPASRPAPKSTSGAAPKPAAASAPKPGFVPVSKPATAPAPKPAAVPASKAVAVPAPKPAASRPASAPAPKLTPAAVSAPKPAPVPASRPAATSRPAP